MKKLIKQITVLMLSLSLPFAGCAEIPDSGLKKNSINTSEKGLVYTDSDGPLDPQEVSRSVSDLPEVKMLSQKEENMNLPAVSSLKPQTRKKKTLLIYMVGSDLESNYDSHAATRDLTEMLDSGFDQPDINLIVYAGGASAWWNGLPASQNCLLVYNAKKGSFDIYSEENRNMAAFEVLTDCLKTVKEKFPAEEYEMFFWNHGGGPLQGYGYDERFEPETDKAINMLSVSEICKAFDENGFDQNPFSLIGFDACLMGTLEVASALSPYTDTLIAAPETEPGTGWDYSFLADFDHKTTPEELSGLVIGSYADSIEQARSSRSNIRYSLVAYDLTKTPALIKAVNDLFAALNGKIKENPQTLTQIIQAARASWTYGYKTGFEMIDLGQFASMLPNEFADTKQAVIDAVSQMIISGRTNIADTTGMSFYLPVEEQEIYEVFGKPALEQLHPVDALQEYIQFYVNEVWKASDQKIEMNKDEVPEVQEEGTIKKYSVPEQLQGKVASASVTLFDRMKNSKGTYYSVLMQDLPAEFDERGNIVVDEDFPIAVTTGSQATILPSVFIQDNAGKQFYRTALSELTTSELHGIYHGLPAVISYLYDPAQKRTVFDSLRVLQNDQVSSFAAMKSDFDGEDYKGFRAYIPWGNELNEQEKTEPYTKKKNAGVLWYSLSFDDNFQVEVVPLSELGNTDFGYFPDFSYQLTIKDLQGNEYVMAFEDLDSDSALKTMKTEHGRMTFYVGEDRAVMTGYEGSDQKIEIPEDVEGVPVRMVKPLESETLQEVVLPDTVEEISENVFGNVNELRKVRLSNQIKTIPANAFDLCRKLESIELPDSVVSIEERAFSRSGLKSLVIPASVKSIGAKAFEECEELQSIQFETGSPFITNKQFILSKDKTILYSFIPGLSEWETAEKEQSGSQPSDGSEEEKPVQIIGFDHQSDQPVKQIRIPDGVTKIADSALSDLRTGYDEKPIHVIFPEGLQIIGNYAFCDSDLDMDLDFPESLEEIGTFSFAWDGFLKEDRESIASVKLGKKINKFGYACFHGREKLHFELDTSNNNFIEEDNKIYTLSGDAEIPLYRWEDDHQNPW